MAMILHAINQAALAKSNDNSGNSCNMRISLQLPSGELVPLDEKGYMLDHKAWTPAVAEAMAAADGLRLERDHWAVLKIFQEYFHQYEIEPPMRALVRLAREQLGEDKGSSRYLYRLFPDGPGTQACRYAGLPRPVSCV